MLLQFENLPVGVSTGLSYTYLLFYHFIGLLAVIMCYVIFFPNRTILIRQSVYVLCCLFTHLWCRYCASLLVNIRMWLCVVWVSVRGSVMCVWVNTPFLKYFSRFPSIPNGTAGELKLGYNVACAVLTSLDEGLTAITTFPISSGSTTAAVNPPASLFNENDLNKIQFDVPFLNTDCIFS